MNPMVATLRNMMRPVATPVIMAWERLESGISLQPPFPGHSRRPVSRL